MLPESHDLAAIPETWWMNPMTGEQLLMVAGVQKGRERKEGKRGCPLHQEMERLHILENSSKEDPRN